MSTTPEALLSLAGDLEKMATEAAWRSAISRAYYAAFHHAQNWHQALPSPGRLPQKQGGVHHDLSGQLCSPTLPTSDDRYSASKKAGYMLREAHASRVKSDYTLDAEVTPGQVRVQILAAEKIFTLLV